MTHKEFLKHWKDACKKVSFSFEATRVWKSNDKTKLLANVTVTITVKGFGDFSKQWQSVEVHNFDDVPTNMRTRDETALDCIMERGWYKVVTIQFIINNPGVNDCLENMTIATI